MPARVFTSSASLAVVALSALALGGCKQHTSEAADSTRSGAVRDGVVARDHASPADVPAPHDSATGAPYPIVLAHGFFGFDEVGPLDYFYKVKGPLEKDGHRVFITTVDPFNSSERRGEQLKKKIEQLLRSSGAKKVNIIGHSQGGLDARYVAAKLPGKVGAVVTVATPHRGARVADVLLKAAPGFSLVLARAFFKLVSRPFYGDVANDTDMKRALEALSSKGVEAFNRRYPNASTVSYYSIAGRSNSTLATSECRATDVPSFISRYASDRDPVDPLLYLIAPVTGESLLFPKPNDGLVQVVSSKWGTFLGCVPADHLDEVGQLAGDKPGGDNTFDHVELYRGIARFLVKKGF